MGLLFGSISPYYKKHKSVLGQIIRTVSPRVAQGAGRTAGLRQGLKGSTGKMLGLW